MDNGLLFQSVITNDNSSYRLCLKPRTLKIQLNIFNQGVLSIL